MESLLPNMFIASSTEGLDYAYALQKGLARYVDGTVWTQGIFHLSRTTFQELIVALDKFSYAAFVLTPDDITHFRSADVTTPRDNVIFELGLFIGRLGLDRCFLVVPQIAEDLHLPTDLLGLLIAPFDPNRADGNLEAALGPVCYDLRVAMGLVQHRTKYGNTVLPLDEHRARELLVHNSFLLIFDPSTGGSKQISFEADGTIGIGRNANETFWRIQGGALELLQSDGQVHSRFLYQSIEGIFINTNDPDTLSKRNQMIQHLPKGLFAEQKAEL